VNSLGRFRSSETTVVSYKFSSGKLLASVPITDNKPTFEYLSD
jgi:hypothetical protein